MNCPLICDLIHEDTFTGAWSSFDDNSQGLIFSLVVSRLLAKLIEELINLNGLILEFLVVVDQLQLDELVIEGKLFLRNSLD